MDKFLARIFIVFLLFLYTGVALVFIATVLRTWVWEPLKKKFSEQHPKRKFHSIKSTSREESPS